MNCPDCDALMFYDDCRCGFKNPPKSTIEIKQMGAQESNYPLILDEASEKLLEQVKANGVPYQGFWLDECKKRINRVKV